MPADVTLVSSIAAIAGRWRSGGSDSMYARGSNVCSSRASPTNPIDDSGYAGIGIETLRNAIGGSSANLVVAVAGHGSRC